MVDVESQAIGPEVEDYEFRNLGETFWRCAGLGVMTEYSREGQPTNIFSRRLVHDLTPLPGTD